MAERERAVAYDQDWWVDDRFPGSAGYVSSEKPDDAPMLLVPDGAGGYREQQIVKRPKGRLGF